MKKKTKTTTKNQKKKHKQKQVAKYIGGIGIWAVFVAQIEARPASFPKKYLIEGVKSIWTNAIPFYLHVTNT